MQKLPNELSVFNTVRNSCGERWERLSQLSVTPGSNFPPNSVYQQILHKLYTILEKDFIGTEYPISFVSIEQLAQLKPKYDICYKRYDFHIPTLLLSLSSLKRSLYFFFIQFRPTTTPLKALRCVRVIISTFFFVGLIKNECLFVPINCKGEPHWSYSFAFSLVITTSSWMDVQQSFCERGTVVANLFLWHLDSSDRN